MSEKPTALSGENLSGTLKSLRGIVTEINDFKDTRREVSASINALRERATTYGVPKAALDMAMRYLDWEPEKREGFDLAYQLVREACGLPVQGDLFAEAERKQRVAAEEERRAQADAAFADTAEKRDARKAEENAKAEQEEGGKVLSMAKKVAASKRSDPPKIPEADAVGIDDQR